MKYILLPHLWHSVRRENTRKTAHAKFFIRSITTIPCAFDLTATTVPCVSQKCFLKAQKMWYSVDQLESCIRLFVSGSLTVAVAKLNRSVTVLAFGLKLPENLILWGSLSTLRRNCARAVRLTAVEDQWVVRLVSWQGHAPELLFYNATKL